MCVHYCTVLSVLQSYMRFIFICLHQGLTQTYKYCCRWAVMTYIENCRAQQYKGCFSCMSIIEGTGMCPSPLTNHCVGVYGGEQNWVHIFCL